MRSNYYTVARKNKYNCSGSQQQLKIIDTLFPVYLRKEDKEEINEQLRTHYDPTKHEKYLIELCFKNPFVSTKVFYDEFRKAEYPQLQEPRISHYYQNVDFVSMDSLIMWLKTEGHEDYPSVSNSADPNSIINALSNVYNQLHYIPNFQRFLLFYPEYLQRFNKYTISLFDETKIDLKNAYFISIITAIEMGSVYMITRCASCFIIHGGNQEWLTKKNYPKRLATLFGFVRKMARCPWSISFEDFKYLRSQQWPNAEILHYILVISWAVSCSTISLALGLVPDEKVQFLDLQKAIKAKQEYDGVVYKSHPNKQKMFDEIAEYIKKYQEPSGKKLKEFESSLIEPYMKQIGKELENQTLNETIIKTFDELSGPYSKVQKRKEDIYQKRQFTINKDENFEDEVYPTLAKYVSEPASRFYELVKFSLNKTYGNFGFQKGTDTSMFRKAVQYYSENLTGVIRQFSYKKYLKINANITMPLRFYVRLLTLNPVYIKQQVLEELNHEKGWISCFDLGHLALLVADTKARLTMTVISECMIID